MTIYAFNEPSQCYVDSVFRSLQAGESRFGWSSEKTADQRILRKRYVQNGWDSLTQNEQNCYHDFLLEITPDDFVVHINVPNWGECTLAKIESAYNFRYEDEDFNHRFKVDPNSVRTFNRNDSRVHPALSARLKLQGRWWRVSKEQEFFGLLEALEVSSIEPAISDRTPLDNLRFLSSELRVPLSRIAEKIHHTHPNKDLENFILEIFENVPGVEKVIAQKGRADKGADLLVEFGFGSIPELLQTIVVQVKSWEGELSDPRPLVDIKNAFAYYQNANMGLIVSTNTSCSDQFRIELDKLREESGKPISLLIGAELALFCLHYGGDLL